MLAIENLFWVMLSYFRELALISRFYNERRLPSVISVFDISSVVNVFYFDVI